MDFNFDQIISTINTSEDKKKIFESIDSFSAKVFTADQINEDSTSKNTSPITDALLESLKKNKIDSKDREKAELFFSKLRQKINSLKTINIIIAIAPTTNLLQLLKKWADENIGEHVIFDIVVDERIIGGAIIIYGGQYIDSSLSSRIDEVFAAKKQELIKQVVNLEAQAQTPGQ